MTQATLPKTIIVTGGSRGIGAAIARMAGTRGAAIAVNYTRGEAEALQVVADIEASGGKAIAIQADMASEADILRLFETAEKTLGPIEGLVNNAGITGAMTKLADLDSDVLSRVFQVNVIGAILCAREAVRRMAKSRGGSGGVIINISSIAARTGGGGEWLHYGASKGAIDSFTRGLANEVAGEDIRVNSVSPGLIDTDMGRHDGSPGRLDRLMPTVPLRRAGHVDEVAETVVWLMSSAASYVHRANLDVGGGR